ncbi:MAG: ABC transporter ATP-binding protein [Dehalococcoidia bacterium]|nr:ABC transporter ATP-binding protein [Dehalococcoidia bacterium]
MADAILAIEDLRTYYYASDGTAKAVDGVSLSLRRESTLAVVGESGCGKTTLGLSVLNLIPHPGRIVSGRILFEGSDIVKMGGEQLRELRGSRIGMIFQDPVSGLNPVLPIGVQVEEIITGHTSLSKKEARQRALQALRESGLPNAERLIRMYPFHLSGGMCQRVMIAIATVLRPTILIADEPTSALDVTVQAGILEQLNRLRRQGMSLLLITHDLGVVAQMADDVAVMYAGRIVEEGTAEQVFGNPRHPYSWALLQSLPRVDQIRKPLIPIRGAPPQLTELPDECAFVPRCPKATTACRTQPAPPLEEISPGHRVACFNPVYSED